MTKKNSTGFSVYKKLDSAIPSLAFDTYWKFAVERQKVFFARMNNNPLPWTNDPIIGEYKFTNAYRASDRVSQYLIKQVIYNGEKDINEIFFRTILFKLFNKIDTWELLKSQLGNINWHSYQYENYEKQLTAAMSSGAAIYSAAYIMASGHKLFNVEKKHQSHLKLIEKMMKESLPERLQNCKSMLEGFELLKSYPLIGDFLAYQLITDINYTEITNFSEMDFTVPGPGAKDGIRKCFKSLGGLSETDIIRFMADRQDYEFDRLGLEFQNLWGRKLQLIDIQNLFCEVDKYSRVMHPEIAGISGRMRIKQKFKEKCDPIQFFYPPKWNLNTNFSS
ncbi:nucleotide kinase domain-containing protein [Methylotenera sp. 1P/1]|uniref:nucleotide kinase domain-containing protein n=1 Tax=Methylotenera sp. 1P/1 TaxID=1131551 RepID=UPI000377B9B4|nr:nucleotide kinase domain-containing protein [Methylotenera sp. 1P/1]